MLNCIIVGLGGFIGAVLRYLISLIPIKNPDSFPINTFIINILGALIIGIIAFTAAKNQNLDAKLILFLKVGICGGFTTFSTFSLETANLIKSGCVLTAIIYILLSVIPAYSPPFCPNFLQNKY